MPIVNVPAGTQTCSIPNASVRTWPAVPPSDGTGVGTAAADGATLGASLGAADGAPVAALVATADGAAAEGAALPGGPRTGGDERGDKERRRRTADRGMDRDGMIDHRQMLPSAGSSPPPEVRP